MTDKRLYEVEEIIVDTLEGLFTKEELIEKVKLEVVDIVEQQSMLLDCPHIKLNDHKRALVYFVDKFYDENSVEQYYITYDMVREWKINMFELEAIAIKNTVKE